MDKPFHDIKPKRILIQPPRVGRPITSVPSYIDASTTKSSKKTSDSENTSEPPRWLTRLLTFLAYGIPLAFLAYVLYINYLPFGYEETFTIDVGAEGDTDSRKAFYLQPSPDLSESKVGADGTTYRELNGLAYAVFKPPVVLKDAEITVTVEGEGVSIIPPVIDFNPDDYEWDYEWDFTNKATAFTPKTSERARADWLSCTTTATSTGTGTSPQTPSTTSLASSTATTTTAQICEQVPVPDLEGNAFWFDGGMYFDGKSRLELPNSADKFEDGKFVLYIEWEPLDLKNNKQQIIGHYNWELWQNANKSAEFQIGRMMQSTEILQIQNANKINFLNKDKQNALFIYSPEDIDLGYSLFYNNGNLIDILKLDNDKINPFYGSRNLSFGWSSHNFSKHPHFTGHIYKVYLGYVIPNLSFSKTNASDLIPLWAAQESSKLFKVKAHVPE